jgi:hypothetical protein
MLVGGYGLDKRRAGFRRRCNQWINSNSDRMYRVNYLALESRRSIGVGSDLAENGGVGRREEEWRLEVEGLRVWVGDFFSDRLCLERDGRKDRSLA